MLNIEVTRSQNLKRKPADESALGFGRIFTDHMFIMDYELGIGWHNARIVPYGDFAMDPAAMVLHYGQAIFEGCKCYRRADGGLQLFRAHTGKGACGFPFCLVPHAGLINHKAQDAG